MPGGEGGETAHYELFAGNDFVQLKDCIQRKLFTLELTICGGF